MTCSESKEPKGSERSSTDSLNELCRCGHQRRRHLEPPGAQCVACSDDEEHSWRHEFTPEKPSPVDCAHVGSRVIERSDAPEHWTRYLCDDCGARWIRNWSEDGEKTEEPPLTPEEHNLGPEGVDCVFDACPRDPDDCENGCRAAADELSREAGEMACQDCLAGVHGPDPAHVCETYYCPSAGEVESACHGGFDVCCGAPEEHVPADQAPPLEAKPPPQPDRRPPYLLAYSVQGHLYELALPGDATVAALDGRLVITHQLGPVAGICQIAPITSEES